MGSFGDRLKKQREQRNISLDDISLSTKIGTRMLRALEEEKFEQLPGGIFNKGFVRAYARHVGLDEEQTISDYITALGEAQQPIVDATPSVPTAKPPASERSSAPILDPPRRESTAEIPWGLLALGLLLAAVAFATWSYYHREQRETGAAPPPPPAQTPPAEPSSGSGASQQIPTTPTENKGAPTSPIPSTDKPRTPTAPVGQLALHGSASPEVAAGAFTVLLKGNDEGEECWVSIVVDGQAPVEAILSGTQEKLIQGNREVVVKAGNIGALDVSFNGRKLGRLGEYGVVRTLTFHGDGLQAPAPKVVVPAATGH
jgi:cytoskeleton protein RodZ